jgi:CheY-like chemotaxis protein
MSKPKEIVLVDDDHLVVGALSKRLSNRGFLVHDILGDPLDAVQRLYGFNPGEVIIFVTDFNILKMTGLELIKYAKNIASYRNFSIIPGIISNNPNIHALVDKRCPVIAKEHGLAALEDFVIELSQRKIFRY